MTEPNPPENLDAGSERSLRKLAWAIEASRGQFKLILARCNYTGVRGRLVRRLQQLVSGEIRILELQASDRTLYGRIQVGLGANVPAALTVFGLEAVGDIELLLTSTNQMREEFQKNFPFPLVLWVTDEVLKKLVRVAPDFESWAIGVEFAVAGEDVASFVRETAERWFANTLRLTRQGGLELEAELQAAEKDLLGGGEGLDKELQANLESLLGAVKFMYNQRDAALEHYQKALGLWRETGNLDRQAKLVSEIALCYSLKAARGEINPSEWQGIGDSLRESLDVFERAERPDLVAISIPLVCGVLRQFEEWEGLRALAEKGLQLHDRENMPVELAQDFGFLAEVELANQRWGEARDFAERALQVLEYDFGQGEGQAGRLSYVSRYLFILAQAQYNLQQFDGAIRNLEAAKEAGSPEYDTQLYIDILHRLQALYSEGKKYLEAFKIKLERLSVEQQYGLRAFVGAGRIQPQRQAKFALTPVVGRGVAPQQENVAPEIAASGRMLDVERLIEKIGRNDSKLIVIHGQSGVGKSSLVNGGLVPALKEKVIGIQDVLPVPVRVYTSWVAELGRALAEAMGEKGAGAGALESGTRHPSPLPARGEGEQDSRMDFVGGNAPGSVEAILEQLRQNEHRHLRTVLIFDQFEEFFFVCTSPAQRRQFFAFLGESLKILSVKVILSLREDYLHYLLESNRQESMKVIGNDILSNNVLYPLGNFSPEDAKSVVERLTERSNFRPDGDLIEELVRDLAGELGEVRPIELQVVGAQLQAEDITTLAEYRSRGPKAEFVKRYLEEVVTDCGAENEQAAEFVLYLLTDEKGTRPLKTRAELERDLQVLAAELAGETSRLDLVLQVCVGSGMVLLLPESPADRYQLVHDYLAALIREQQQPKFNELIAELEREREQRQFAEAQRKLAEEERERAAQNLKEMQELIKLERDGLNALREYEFRQIEALVSAMRAWQELKALVKNRPVEDYPTATPILAVQTILDSIWERNQLKGHQGGVSSANFSPDGKRILTASDDSTARVWDSTGKLLYKLKGHQGPVISASFSPDGKRILTASRDKTARVWDSTGKLLHELKGHQRDVSSASFSPDGKLILTASDDSTARVWDSTGKLLAELKGHQGTVRSASFSPDGKRILTASSDGTARVWDSTGNLLSELKGHQGGVTSASFSPDGKLILTASDDGTARVWDSTGNQLSELKGHQGTVFSASFSPDGKRILTASSDGTARVWDSTGNQLYELKGHQGFVFSASFSPDGKRILTASWDSTARVWDSTGKLLHELKGHQGTVFSASFSPDGKRILTASPDKTARVWDSTDKQLYELKGHHSAVYRASFSPDGKRILTASYDITARVWDSTGKQLSELKGHQGVVRTTGGVVPSASFSSDGKRIVTASGDSTALVWDSTGKLLYKLKGHQGPVISASFSPDGKCILTASYDTTARVWDRTGKLLHQLTGHQGCVISASFSPDGQRILTASNDGTARVWDSTSKLLSELKGHQDSVISASFSPDGTRILTASWDRTARVWDSTGKLLSELKGHQGAIWNASFSPDGKRILTASSDNTARVWDSTGKLLSELKGHQRAVTRASFSPDGKWVLTASDDRTARVWDSTGKQLYEFKGHQGGVSSASFSPDGKWVLTACDDNTARVWRVYSLDELLARGCDWLNDYLVTHPKDLEKLEVCQTQSNRLEAAQFLVESGEEEARGGNVDEAVSTFRTALKWNPSLTLNPATKAKQLAEAPKRVKKGEQLAEEGNIDRAVAEFKNALQLDPNFEPAPLLVIKGEKLVGEGKVKEAIAAYAKAQKLDPKFDIYAESWNTLCRYGSLHRHAKDVLFACEKAVALAPYNERYRDSRGIARALTGNPNGAIEDFQAFIAWIDSLPSWRQDFYKEEKSQRQRWVDALKAGKNPFTDEELKRLLKE